MRYSDHQVPQEVSLTLAYSIFMSTDGRKHAWVPRLALCLDLRAYGFLATQTRLRTSQLVAFICNPRVKVY